MTFRRSLALAAALSSAAVARADSSVSERFTVGPAPLNGGLPYYGNDLDAQIALGRGWKLGGEYLLATDELGLVHQTFELGPTWDPTDALELSGYLFVSPYVQGTAIVQAPDCRPAGGGVINLPDRLASGAAGGDVNGTYQFGPDHRSVSLGLEGSATSYRIDQSLTPPYCGGAAPRPRAFSGTLDQYGIELSLDGWLRDTHLVATGTYFLYSQDPGTFGQIRLRGVFPVTLGGMASGAAGLPTQPMTYDLTAAVKQKLWDQLLISFTYGYLQYVDGDGNGDAFTPRVAWQVTDLVNVSASYTLQLEFSPQGPGQVVPGQAPPVENLFSVGAELDW